MLKNIVITGMRGTGKSKIGQCIAKILKRPFVDLDREIEKIEGMPISEIVNKHGWPYFREIENKIVEKFAGKKDLIISTGGGAIIDPVNEKHLHKNGFIVFLYCDIDTLAGRIKHAKNRPSITGNDFLEELEDVWKKRERRYRESADLTFDVSKTSNDKQKDMETKAEKILSLLP